MRKLILLVAMLAMVVIVAAPASADDFDLDEDVFFGFSTFSTIDEVDYVNVRERNPKDGECFVDDLDLDGVIAEYELTCYR